MTQEPAQDHSSHRARRRRFKIHPIPGRFVNHIIVTHKIEDFRDKLRELNGDLSFQKLSEMLPFLDSNVTEHNHVNCFELLQDYLLLNSSHGVCSNRLQVAYKAVADTLESETCKVKVSDDKMTLYVMVHSMPSAVRDVESEGKSGIRGALLMVGTFLKILLLDASETVPFESLKEIAQTFSSNVLGDMKHPERKEVLLNNVSTLFTDMSSKGVSSGRSRFYERRRQQLRVLGTNAAHLLVGKAPRMLFQFRDSIYSRALANAISFLCHNFPSTSENKSLCTSPTFYKIGLRDTLCPPLLRFRRCGIYG